MHLSTVLLKQNTLSSSRMPEYDLDKLKGKVQTTMKVVILPFKAIRVKGHIKLNIHSKVINVLIEPTLSYSHYIALVQAYGVVQLGSQEINIHAI